MVAWGLALANLTVHTGSPRLLFKPAINIFSSILEFLTKGEMATPPRSEILPKLCYACLDLDPEQHARYRWERPGYNGDDVFLHQIAFAAKAGCRGCKVLMFVAQPCVEFEEWHNHDVIVETTLNLPNSLEVKVRVDDRGLSTLATNDGYRRFELNKLPGQDDGL